MDSSLSRPKNNYIPSNIVGVTIHAKETSPSASIHGTMPPYEPLYHPREGIFRAKTAKKGAKGSLRPNNVLIPNLDDYIVICVDPGTSSMATRVDRRVHGVYENKHWETKDFLVDSTLVSQVSDYIDNLLDVFKPNLAVVEIQLSRYGIEFTQHIAISACISRGITVVSMQPVTRYRAFGLPARAKDNDKKMCEYGLDIMERARDFEGLQYLADIKGIISKNDTKVSAQKRRSDLLTVVTLSICAECLLTQAAIEVTNRSF